MSPASQVERIRRFYEPIFERMYDNPNQRLRDLGQIEEERRLLYVAMTRPRRTLSLYFPLRYYFRKRRGDRHSYAQLTRFIPESARSLFRFISAEGVREHESASQEAANVAGEAIDTMLDDLWSE